MLSSYSHIINFLVSEMVSYGRGIIMGATKMIMTRPARIFGLTGTASVIWLLVKIRMLHF